MVFSTAGFAPVFLKKLLNLKSLKNSKGQTKAEELGNPVPELFSLCLPLQAL
jgi:hypothetical protein